ncbi:hypothetical protein EPUS_02494 [Endocarpon pusillum Z07020]|uniref:Uncharacterized protein n=1 Tax=Endocarpon pusillum (strain Z07020 / HMAS-L-300199) TaxID=1263415 RepID=U1GEX2_ENDPU|nr:uncharacterized protein EPUS_02494 [Endocarpon pusillum Z07020]ERF70628.1 hypothetical protein EPUS_02494 [Endocarpon pusillum Z07020]
MGLPMFREPGESSPQKVAEKAERAAASSRSAIRRERTIRDTGRLHRFSERNENEVPNGAATVLSSGTRPRNRVRMRQDRGTEQQIQSRAMRRWGPILDAARRGDEGGVHDAIRRSVDEELRGDGLQHQRSGRGTRVPRSPRTSYTSALRFEVAPTSRSLASPERSVEEQALLARPYMPSPPYSFSDNSAVGLRLRATEGTTGFIPADPTPGFAPARGVHRDNEEHEPATSGSAPRHHTPPGESSWTASYPPLRRVSHLSPRLESDRFSLSGSGGLGDRRRSVSSSSSDPGQDTWETLLTTMEPDAQLPSTDSSFTSATASQSTRQSRQASQSRNTSFVSATTPTERAVSRTTSPSWPYRASYGNMDLDIRSTQYDCLSMESRGSMRTMLDIIADARQARAGNPAGELVQFHGPRSDENPMLTVRHEQAERNREPEERDIVLDENRILAHHFTTLRTMDELRASNNARARGMARTEIPSWQRQHEANSTSNNNNNNVNINRRPRNAHDLLRAIEHQTQQIAQDLQETETGPASRPDTPSRGFAQAAEDFHRLGSFGPQTQTGTRDTTAEPENDLESMHRLIQRIARREDIPSEWWASAGLARTIRENQ